MSQKVVLLDLENNPITASLLREITNHYTTLYLFNCKGTFEFALQDLTEFSAWVSSGQIVILDTIPAEKKEYEYAMLVGQLLALLAPRTHIEVISASETSGMLMLMMQASHLSVNLIQVEQKPKSSHLKYQLPSIESIQKNPNLQLVKDYCNVVNKMSGKPNTIVKLKNSLINTLQIDEKKTQQLVGMLINLKIVKRDDEKVEFRKKVFKQWVHLDVTESKANLQTESHQNEAVFKQIQQADHALEAEQNFESENELFKNFEVIDPIQIEVARKLRELKTNKPKDIYALRDLLEQMFPKSDVRLLIKELLEKGYIYWNGHEVLYSHEMFLN